MTKEKWIWMPHAGHLIVGNDCRFHLNTYVGKYIVSTVGEYWPDREVRKTKAEISGWSCDRIGAYWDAEFFKKFGFEEIGYGRTYETMVFKAVKNKNTEGLCCPWVQASGRYIDFAGYSDPTSAYEGHLKLCQKWSKK